MITCSEPLFRAKSLLNRNTVLVRHGVEHAHFARALEPATAIPEDVRRLPRPLFGFYGLIAPWVDLELLGELARAHPLGSVVLIGECNPQSSPGLERLRALPNVHLLGRRDYASLPAYCKAFDVALLPFVLSELTRNANPLKLREYLAAGLPVVATRIPEAETLAPRGVRVAGGATGFLAEVAAALAAGPGPSRARSLAVANESWDGRVAEIEEKLLGLWGEVRDQP